MNIYNKRNQIISSKFNIGDIVTTLKAPKTLPPPLLIITDITYYEAMGYFSYWVDPSPGYDIPEDELKIFMKKIKHI